jgi:integron integrase
MTSSEAVQEIKEKCRVLHFSLATERSYCSWIKRYAHFCVKSGTQGRQENAKLFLNEIALKSSAATQKQALNAIAFFYKNVIKEPLGDISGFKAAKKPQKIPVWLSKREVNLLFSELNGTVLLMVKICYGSGLRLAELTNLRVKDLDFDNNLIHIHGGKGNKDRMTCLPAPIKKELKNHLEKIKKLHENDRKNNLPGVCLPDKLENKFKNSGKEWGWFWVFPQNKISKDPRSGIVRRHHFLRNTFQNQIPKAAEKAGITKRVTAHTFRHSFATHLLIDGKDLRVIQKLLGHKSIETTMIYLHCVPDLAKNIKSPLESLGVNNCR